MNKMEYLERLESCLKWKVSKRELDDIMRDYAEYFEEGRRQSNPDSEISAKLGDPEIVAQQIIEESRQPKASYQEPRVKEHKKHNHRFFKKAKRSFKVFDLSIGRFLYLIMTFPVIVLSTLLPIIMFIFMVGIVSMLGFISIASLLGGVLMMIGSGICFVLVSPQIGVTALFAMAAAISFGVCFACLTISAARKFWNAVYTCLGWASDFIHNVLSVPYKMEPDKSMDYDENESECEPDSMMYDEPEAPPYKSPTDPLYHNLQEIMKNKESQEVPPTVSENPTSSSSAEEPISPSENLPKIEEESAPETIDLTLSNDEVDPYIESSAATEENLPKKIFPTAILNLEE